MILILILLNLFSFVFSSNIPEILEIIAKKFNQNNFKIGIDNQIQVNILRNVTKESKIINGEQVQPGAFPFMISLGLFSADSYFHRCGGSIINDEYILTAAHCVKDLGDLYDFNTYYEKNKKVLVSISGTENIAGFNFLSLLENGYFSLIDKIMLNKNYVNTTNPEDIAILRVKNKISFSPTVFAINLPKSNDTPNIYGKIVTTIGWGETQTGSISTQLLKTTLTVLNGTPLQNECESYYQDHYCTKDISGKDSNVCYGDSGSPLLSIEDNQWIIYGITSFVFVDNDNKCLNTYPSFFAMVPRLVDWINSNINLK